MIKSMINFIKKNPLPAAIVLLAITQVPGYFSDAMFNQCVVETRADYKNFGRRAHLNAVHRCNGGANG